MKADIKIIKQFIRILEEAKLKFRGSPKGAGPSRPYAEKEVKPPLGKSEYDDLDELPEKPKEEKVKVSKYLKQMEEDKDDS